MANLRVLHLIQQLIVPWCAHRRIEASFQGDLASGSKSFTAMIWGLRKDLSHLASAQALQMGPAPARGKAVTSELTSSLFDSFCFSEKVANLKLVCTSMSACASLTAMVRARRARAGSA